MAVILPISSNFKPTINPTITPNGKKIKSNISLNPHRDTYDKSLIINNIRKNKEANAANLANHFKIINRKLFILFSYKFMFKI